MKFISKKFSLIRNPDERIELIDSNFSCFTNLCSHDQNILENIFIPLQFHRNFTSHCANLRQTVLMSFVSSIFGNKKKSINCSNLCLLKYKLNRTQFIENNQFIKFISEVRICERFIMNLIEVTSYAKFISKQFNHCEWRI